MCMAIAESVALPHVISTSVNYIALFLKFLHWCVFRLQWFRSEVYPFPRKVWIFLPNRIVTFSKYIFAISKFPKWKHALWLCGVDLSLTCRCFSLFASVLLYNNRRIRKRRLFISTVVTFIYFNRCDVCLFQPKTHTPFQPVTLIFATKVQY